MEGFTTCLCYAKGLIVIGSRVLFWWIIPSKIFTEQVGLQDWWSITILLAGLRRSGLALSSKFSHWSLGGWNWLLRPWPKWQGDKQSWEEASGPRKGLLPDRPLVPPCSCPVRRVLAHWKPGTNVWMCAGEINMHRFYHFSESKYTILQKLFLNPWGILPE